MTRTFSIPNQRPNEQIVYVLRRHWIRFVQRLIGAFFLFLAPLLPLLFARDAILTPVEDQTPVGILIVMGASLYYLFIGIFLFHGWLDYYLDAWIVTTDRILNIEQKGLFSRIVSELKIENVQDVTVEVHGVIPTMFKFGDLHVQTAAEQSRFHFDDIPNPSDVARNILNLHDRITEEHRAGMGPHAQHEEGPSTPS